MKALSSQMFTGSDQQIADTQNHQRPSVPWISLLNVLYSEMNK